MKINLQSDSVKNSVSYRAKHFLKRFKFLVNVKRVLFSLLQLNRQPYAFKGISYFKKLNASNPNLVSLDFSDSLVVGNFKGINYFLKYRNKGLIETRIYVNGNWEFHILDLISSFLTDEEGIMVDVGSNIGAISIPLAKKHCNINFLLFEPHPEIYKILCNNLSINKLNNVNAHNKAVSDKSGSILPFYAQINSNNMGLSSFNLNPDISEYEIVEVSCVGLDDFVEKETKRIKVLKVDTQGSELSVLYSATRVLKNDRPVVFFEFESEYHSSELEGSALVSFFQELDYSLYSIQNGLNFLTKVNFKGYYNGDVIALPNNLKSK